MKAGELRERVTIQEKGTVTRDATGAEVITWSDVATVWADVSPLLGREFLEGRMAEAEVTTRIRIRYRDGIDPAMRVVHRSSTYDIVSVQHVRSRKQELVLMCREVLDSADYG